MPWAPTEANVAARPTPFARACSSRTQRARRLAEVDAVANVFKGSGGLRPMVSVLVILLALLAISGCEDDPTDLDHIDASAGEE